MSCQLLTGQRQLPQTEQNGSQAEVRDSYPADELTSYVWCSLSPSKALWAPQARAAT